MLSQITSIFQVLIEPFPLDAIAIAHTVTESHFEIVPSFTPINYAHAVTA